MKFDIFLTFYEHEKYKQKYVSSKAVSRVLNDVWICVLIAGREESSFFKNVLWTNSTYKK